MFSTSRLGVSVTRTSVLLLVLLAGSLLLSAVSKADIQIGESGDTLTIEYPDDPVSGEIYRTQIYEGSAAAGMPSQFVIYTTAHGSFLGPDVNDAVEDAHIPDRDVNRGCGRTTHGDFSLSPAAVCDREGIRHIRIIGSRGVDEIYVGTPGTSSNACCSDLAIPPDPAISNDIDVSVDARSGNDRIDFEARKYSPYGVVGGAGDDRIINQTGLDHDGMTVSFGPDGHPTLTDVTAPAYFGGTGDDYISVKNSSAIDGESGNDVIHGGLRRDFISGGFGDDTVVGRGGDDILSGDVGNDFVLPGDGNDRVHGDEGNDRIRDDDGGADSLSGDAGNDWIQDRQGVHDVLSGGAGNDWLDSREALAYSFDWLIGGPGDDTMLALDGSEERIRCESGTDRVVADQSIDIFEDNNCELGIDKGVASPFDLDLPSESSGTGGQTQNSSSPGDGGSGKSPDSGGELSGADLKNELPSVPAPKPDPTGSTKLSLTEKAGK